MKFPGVIVFLNQGLSAPAASGRTVGTVVNHIGFVVRNVQRVDGGVESSRRAGGAG